MPLRYRFAYRRNLPHIQPEGATLFVTFRLAGTLPAEALVRLRREADEMERQVAQIANLKERTERLHAEKKRQFGRIDTLLDQAITGEVWLQLPEIARAVTDTLHYLDGKKYTLHAYCVMPNHVHLVFEPLVKADGTAHSLSSILFSLKRHTAGRANQILGRTGQFWQHESYDRVVRDAEEWQRIVGYILDNPVKAGLVQTSEEWPWSYCRFIEEAAAEAKV